MKTLVLDAGHGGRDPGAVGHGLLEKDLTLDRALAIRRGLSAYDIRVLLTRDDDTFVHIGDRARFANNARADLFVSLHNNAFTNPAARGFETFAHPATRSNVQRVMHPIIVGRTNASPDRGQKSADFQVLRQTQMPAILLEELFISNPQDAALLKDPVWRQAYVDGVVEGILAFFGMERMGTANEYIVEIPASSYTEATKIAANLEVFLGVKGAKIIRR